MLKNERKYDEVKSIRPAPQRAEADSLTRSKAFSLVCQRNFAFTWQCHKIAYLSDSAISGVERVT